MVGASVYDWMYRVWAPWDAAGVRKDLIDVLGQGLVDPIRFPRALDLGCGTGENVIHLADVGFDVTGVDFSPVAIGKARQKAEERGSDATFVVGDLTSVPVADLTGPYDFLLDFGTLDDLRASGRSSMARNVTALARPGAKFLEYCFYGSREELPVISFRGASRMSHIAPGELEGLFGRQWSIEQLAHYQEFHTAVFLLTRTED